MSPCLLIPIHDHGSTIRRVTESVAPANLPRVMINDRRNVMVGKALDRIAKDFDWVEVRHHAFDQSKGAALATGYRAAAARGFAHAIHLDAGCQHESADVQRFVVAAHANPHARLLGRPVLDDEAPKRRLYGRTLSAGLVWLATLSREVTEPLCDFRRAAGADLPTSVRHLPDGISPFDLVWDDVRLA